MIWWVNIMYLFSKILCDSKVSCLLFQIEFVVAGNVVYPWTYGWVNDYISYIWYLVSKSWIFNHESIQRKQAYNATKRKIHVLQKCIWYLWCKDTIYYVCTTSQQFDIIRWNLLLGLILSNMVRVKYFNACHFPTFYACPCFQNWMWGVKRVYVDNTKLNATKNCR